MFQLLENGSLKSSNRWKFFAVLFPMLGSLAMAQGPGSISQGGFFQAWWGAASAVDPYETLLPTAYWYPSKDLSNTDRILGIANTNTINTPTTSANGWEFNGTSHVLDMGQRTEIEPGTNLLYSMAVWVYPRVTNSALRGIMGKGDFARQQDRWALFSNTGTNGLGAFVQQGSSGGTVFLYSGSYNSNNWFHLAYVLDRSQSSGFKLYRDGVLSATGTFTDTNAITYDGQTPNPHGFRFGVLPNDGVNANYWNGYIDQAAVWKGKALTSNEVFNLFQDTRSGRK
jgi:hypothetical protein